MSVQSPVPTIFSYIICNNQTPYQAREGRRGNPPTLLWSLSVTFGDNRLASHTQMTKENPSIDKVAIVTIIS